VISPQLKDDVSYTFDSWSNNGSPAQTITTPEDDLTLTARYSIVVGVEGNAPDDDISVYPNPSPQGYFMISISSPAEAPVTIRLLDVLSREVAATSRDLHPGDNRIAFDSGKINDGLYTLYIDLGDRIVSKKVVVLH
jgi:hypothetical protein